MALYVRIAVNVGDVGDVRAVNINDSSALRLEDAYAEYDGCRECGLPLESVLADDSWRKTMDGEEATKLGWAVIRGRGGCPRCHEGASEEDDYDIDDSYDSTVYLKQYNPTVDIGQDGSLSVMRGEERLGFYPTGAWISYRSD